MSKDDPLPEWANVQVAASQQKIAALDGRLDAYNRELNDLGKAQILGEAIALLEALESSARRFKFFIKASGLVEARASLEAEVSGLEEKGIPVRVESSPRLVNVLFVDTETTGLNAGDQPISIGAVLSEIDIKSGAILSEVASYYGLREPSCEISQSAFRVHGLSKSQLQGKEFDLRELASLFGAAELIVAHNAKFDRRMLKFIDEAHRRWGCSCWDVEWPQEIGGRSLDTLCSYFAINRAAPHNSISDTRAMMHALQQEQSDGSTYLVQLLRKHGIAV